MDIKRITIDVGDKKSYKINVDIGDEKVLPEVTVDDLVEIIDILKNVLKLEIHLLSSKIKED